MRTIGVVTVARSDYGIYLPILRAIEAAPDLQLWLIAAAAHFVAGLGSTADQIEADGFVIAERVEMLLASDTPEANAKSMGLGIVGFAQVFSRLRPDLLLVLGDRPEMHAAALAALPFTIPVAHIHGGELSLGAVDDALRHSLTKLSHLHFTSTPEHAARVIQMGEEPWRVTVSGAPALDRLADFRPWPATELERHVGIRLTTPPILVTFHPATLEPGSAGAQCSELLAALTHAERPIVFTGSNADSGGRVIEARVAQFVNGREDACLVSNVGNQAYFSLMAHAAVMVGNSSSGLIEAPSFGLPVVNVGTRQHGRLRARNVIDVGARRDEISGGIRRALDPAFRASLTGLTNPYGTGKAAQTIVEVLRTTPIGDVLTRKQFRDIPRAVPEFVSG